MLVFCVSVVCASLFAHLSVAPVLYLSVILNSKAAGSHRGCNLVSAALLLGHHHVL